MIENEKTVAVGRGSVRALTDPQSVNLESRTVDVIWSTGMRVLRGVFSPYYEELDMNESSVRLERLRSGAPLLNAHRSGEMGDQVGVVETAEVDGVSGRSRVRFVRDGVDAAADSLFGKVADGIARNLSIGYDVHRYEQVGTAPLGDQIIPVLRAVDWEPYEESFVPVPADFNTDVRSKEKQPTRLVPVTGWRSVQDKDTGVGKDNEETEQGSTITAASGEEREQATSAERERVQAILRVGRKMGMSPDDVADHVEKGTPIDKVRELAIDGWAAKQTEASKINETSRVEGRNDERDKLRDSALAWMVHRSVKAAKVVEAFPGTGYQRDGNPFGGMSMMDMARECLRRAGVRLEGKSKLEVAARALGMRGAGYAATGDFPAILENTLNKTLLANYRLTADTWSQFCSVGSVVDFREVPRYRRGSIGRLQRVNEHGEFKNLPIPDARKEKNQAETYGNIIALTRQAMINDDMGAFLGLAADIGRAARRSIEIDVYALLAENGGLGPLMNDGLPLFDAAHLNISTPAALSAAAIDIDRQTMAKQTDESGNDFLDIRPFALLVPITLGSKARSINQAEFNPDDIASREPNTVNGLFERIVDTPRITGTRRYLWADPADAACLEVVFLDGQQEPFLDMQDGWRIDGREWKARLDYGVGAIDFRGGVTNAGA